jgi:hypothetical protein
VLERIHLGFCRFAIASLMSENTATANPATNGEKGQADDRIPSEDPTEYPTGLTLVMIILALYLAVFLVALDRTIVATAIPRITDRFHSVQDIGWYGSVSLSTPECPAPQINQFQAYFLTSTSLQPTFGRVYKTFPVRYITCSL